MDNRQYKTAQEFATDVRLIFTNCYKYNPPDHDVVSMARKLQDIFEMRFVVRFGQREHHLKIPHEESQVIFSSFLKFYFIILSKHRLFIRYAKIPDEPMGSNIVALKCSSSGSASSSGGESSSDSDDSVQERTQKLLALQQEVKLSLQSRLSSFPGTGMQRYSQLRFLSLVLVEGYAGANEKARGRERQEEEQKEETGQAKIQADEQ